MAYGAGPGDCNSDCQICLGIEYFNSSPNTVLVQGELCVLKALGKKSKVSLGAGGVGSAPSLATVQGESTSCFYFLVSVSFCVKRGVWENSD